MFLIFRSRKPKLTPETSISPTLPTSPVPLTMPDAIDDTELRQSQYLVTPVSVPSLGLIIEDPNKTPVELQTTFTPYPDYFPTEPQEIVRSERIIETGEKENVTVREVTEL